MPNWTEDEVLGALGVGEDDDDDMGAPRRGAGSRLLRQNIAPGVGRVGRKVQPMGMGVAGFVVAGPVQINLTSAPQRLYQPRKMVVSVARFGVTSTGLVTLQNVAVGGAAQAVSGVPLPSGLFGEATQENRIQWDQASPGVNISMDVNLGLPLLLVADLVDVSVGFIGETLG